MIRSISLRKLYLAGAVALLGIGTLTAATDPAAYFRQAPTLVNPEKAPIYAATQIGKQSVAVGDYGIILLGETGGHLRQAQVPTRAPLTGVHFIDEKHGWAVGHDGTILVSEDGGNRWSIQREAPGSDEVLTSVWFESATHGLAIGQFGLALQTDDGGKTWQEIRVAEGEAGERHLLQLVPAAHGVLLIAGEAGTLFRSTDAGRHWSTIQTTNKGSFWTGLALTDGAILMAGMRGHIFRSDDAGLNWHEVASGTQQSITGIRQHADGSIRLVGLSGANIISKDGGHHFSSVPRPDRISLTAIAGDGNRDTLFTAIGAVIRD